MHIYLVWISRGYKATGLSISAPCAEGIIERVRQKKYNCFDGKMAYILYLGNLWHITLHSFDNPKNSPPTNGHSSHPLHIFTAFSHLRNFFSRSSELIFGSKIFVPTVLMFFNASKLSQTPTAKPAAIAAPSAVVSNILGRSTGIPMRSACVCDCQ
jgi:hypothetical protein